jgi:two-component system chemotaxis sensor kinase CheA
LKLPLTLAIVDSLLVEVAKTCFALPLSLVEECIEFTHEEAARSRNRRLVNVRGEIVPYIALRELFLIHGEVPSIQQIVIAGIDGFRTGFVVDRVIGEHQTVIKSLGKIYRDVEGISGATILGDGTVAFILDVPKLVRLAEADEAGIHSSGRTSGAL